MSDERGLEERLWEIGKRLDADRELVTPQSIDEATEAVQKCVEDLESFHQLLDMAGLAGLWDEPVAVEWLEESISDYTKAAAFVAPYQQGLTDARLYAGLATLDELGYASVHSITVAALRMAIDSVVEACDPHHPYSDQIDYWEYGFFMRLRAFISEDSFPNCCSRGAVANEAAAFKKMTGGFLPRSSEENAPAAEDEPQRGLEAQLAEHTARLPNHEFQLNGEWLTAAEAKKHFGNVDKSSLGKAATQPMGHNGVIVLRRREPSLPRNKYVYCRKHVDALSAMSAIVHDRRKSGAH